MILCITHSQDFYTIDLFFQYLSSKNIPYFRLNSDQLNHLQKISINENSFEITDESGNTIHSDDIKGVWHRKAWRISVPEELDENYEKIFQIEYGSLRYNLFTSLEDIPWINPFEKEKKIDGNKMLQLKIAQRNHLTIPKTMFSNDEEKITTFFHQYCSGKAIAKLHGVQSKTMSGENLISTMIIEEETLEYLSDIAYCPMIFQPYIDKEYELRIMYVDGVFFTGKINNSSNADWRISNENYFWSAYELPENIKINLTSMMKEMGLYMGAIDVIKGKDGEYYFLEVNPQGEWGMLQKELGFPIAERIADNLIKRINFHE
ncbi:ATP-grasp ribosomal peptide maturase [Chryseobacterium joostei]|uniref:ATP-grasp ribosomal peptide maturase n=1 Tax=Chryseobacterium joostei TaxID=112234 RepID=A0A1N7I269_9FLAO|nr:MvdC family ATP-grasp ribosomal peptide maturase [Chryseobacterium joostei]AZA99580.1 ATP-grasp ribosomal peptide maturase [Chryseobacterium joostei]SIS31179.1 ATP-grasp ribosomal peptide maturase, MvdC family [Chryseobacterium joostei]SIS48373.1 ATP-grasp ribosomal peptide maturase, MvdC family [Chryseobacterium joostei]